MNIRLYSIVLLMLLNWLSSQAQIRVSRVDVNRWIKENFSGQGVVVGNVKFRGNLLSIGAFSSSGNVLELQKGLALSTGSAFNVAGLNNKYNQTYAIGDADKDPDLQMLVKPNLYDISMIEFDFVPMGNSLQFNYQFGSEEYPEYVGSTYNDVFAFFVSDENTKSNIAVIPGKDVPVSINTVNHKTNSEFFIDNNVFSSAVIKRQAPVAPRHFSFFPAIWHGIKKIFSSKPEEDSEQDYIRTDPSLVKKAKPALYRFLQFDGITKKLIAQTYVVPYKKYHLKIIIADVADNIYDSGVFIEDKSLSAKRDTMQPNFIDYPDLGKLIDPKQILAGKKLEDLLPDTVYLDDANIYFEFDKAEIPASEMSKVKGIAATFDRVKDKYTMRVAGHTDSIGNLQYNMALSRKRNQAVMDALQKLRTIDIPIEITEDAFLKPAAKNDTDEGRMKNRRVEIFFVKRD